MEKKITLFGKELTIRFNMAVQLTYEQIVGIAFNPTDLQKTRNRMALYYSAIVVSNPGIEFSIDDLLNAPTLEPIHALDAAVSECMKAWYCIPPTVEKDEQETDSQEEPKND